MVVAFIKAGVIPLHVDAIGIRARRGAGLSSL